MRIGSEICYRIARRLASRRKPGAAGANPAAFDRSAYQDWRQEELEEQLTSYFSPDVLQGKDVIDFGFGSGQLSFIVARLGVRSIHGVEINREQYDLACRRAAELNLPVTPTFQLSTDSKRIARPDGSCDVILCFDALEHIIDYEHILREWWRILRPNGLVLVWWVPYYHPYGHHVESLVPIPWAHVFFSQRMIIDTCARIYDEESFVPRFWDVDPAGQKRPNKWAQLNHLPTLNQLTIRKLERLCQELGFTIERRQYHPISSSSLVKGVTTALIKLPYFNEFLSSCVIYELRKPPRRCLPPDDAPAPSNAD